MCDSCNAMMINGVRCHEHGCPEAWKDKSRECRWCGAEFKPETREQQYCSEECMAIDMGFDQAFEEDI